ncbi:MAG: M48 family metallopeptidase [Actinobacteria bacterium]|nr:M48 family metallopeptidase [Actinomycetota bacterium]
MADRDYIIRESKRAKHVLLKMSPRDGLVVVVPRGFNLEKVPEIVEKKRPWIDKAHAKVEPQRMHLLAAESSMLPERISLKAIGGEWDINYHADDLPYVDLEEPGDGRLYISGGINSIETVRTLLRKWLVMKARIHLGPHLHEIAVEQDFKIRNIKVRFQKTRWGSCSGDDNISLNAKLLFLPGELVEYIFFHELCHTVHKNHSPEFWSLLEKHVPDFKTRRKELKTAWQYVPAWLDIVV